MHIYSPCICIVFGCQRGLGTGAKPFVWLLLLIHICQATKNQRYLLIENIKENIQKNCVVLGLTLVDVVQFRFSLTMNQLHADKNKDNYFPLSLLERWFPPLLQRLNLFSFLTYSSFRQGLSYRFRPSQNPLFPSPLSSRQPLSPSPLSFWLPLSPQPPQPPLASGRCGRNSAELLALQHKCNFSYSICPTIPSFLSDPFT